MSAKHTPGPWSVSPYGDDIHHEIHGASSVIAITSDVANDDEENVANACLIASAPDMLTELISILDMCRRGVFIHADGGSISVGDIEAVIAKATGGPIVTSIGSSESEGAE